MLLFVEASSEICKASKERVRTCKDYIIGREIISLLKMTVDNVILEFCESCDYFAYSGHIPLLEKQKYQVTNVCVKSKIVKFAT